MDGSRCGYLSRQVEQLSFPSAKHIRTTTIPVPRRVFNTTMTTSFAASLDAIKAVLPANLQSPRVAIICGSGLSGIVDALRDVVLVPYQNIPGFSTSTGKYTILAATCSKFLHSVPGHKSALAFGFLGNGEGVPVVAMLGRVRKTTLGYFHSDVHSSFTLMKGIRCPQWFIRSESWRSLA